VILMLLMPPFRDGLVRALMEKGPPRVPDAELLTRREHEVLAEPAEGRPNRTIAAEPGISMESVEANVRNVLRKPGLEDEGRYDRRPRRAWLDLGGLSARGLRRPARPVAARAVAPPSSGHR
jgi:DNA-binding NarL/FixJ family response regulator